MAFLCASSCLAHDEEPPVLVGVDDVELGLLARPELQEPAVDLAQVVVVERVVAERQHQLHPVGQGPAYPTWAART